MIKRFLSYSLLVISLIYFTSCTGTKSLKEGEYLVRHGELEIASKVSGKELSDAKNDLQKLVNFKENTKIFWMRPRLSLYNMIEEQETEEGIKYWLKNKVGTPPEIYSQSSIDRVIQSMEAQMFNYGFFNVDISCQLKTRKNEIKPLFIVRTSELYKIGKVEYKATVNPIDSILEKNILLEDLKPGSPYHLNTLIEVRSNLANQLLNKGYYFFKPDHLEFLADTNLESGKVNLILRLKPDNPLLVYESYKINAINIKDNFRLNERLTQDTLKVKNLNYISPFEYIKPDVVANTVHLNKGGLYNRDDHIRTLTHIRSLNVYQFVNIQYDRIDSLPGKLNSTIYLIPMRKMSVSGELNANFKSNNYAGPGILLSFLNRNTFKKAELLNISLSGRFEAQIGQKENTNFAYEFRTDASLQFPRLYPFKSKKVSRRYLPTTTLNLGLGLQERVEYFQMVTGNIGLKYNWKTSDRLQQRFSPYEVILSNLLKRTEAFEEYLSENPTVRRSFEEQFILGPTYEIFINSRSEKLSPMFFGFSIDVSGNIISGAKILSGENSTTPDSQLTLFGLPYSQFVRSRIDFRYNLRLSKNNYLASRLVLGAGIPYGNSNIMPYIKQYFVGGPNSLRGFAARTIGPGKYRPLRDDDQQYLVDQAGDLKIETNFEYRFPILSALKGAVFTDIGNIWLVNVDSARPGGKFVFDEFIDEFAISSGVGLRLDFSPILFRFDFGWPMRYPFPVNGNKWVIRDIEFFSREWRRKNIILNISLGYPF